MRRFAILGPTVRADAGFLLNDVAGTSGRLDVLLRCIRAAMLASHGLRAGVIVYLVLGADPRAPRVIRLDSAAVRFLRPDERNLAVLIQKVLASDEAALEARPPDTRGPTAFPVREGAFVQFRPGIGVGSGGLAEVLADAPGARVFVLDEGAPDLRTAALEGDDQLFVIGGHKGIPDDCRPLLERAQPIGIGPVSIHADDVVAVLVNELDRRGC